MARAREATVSLGRGLGGSRERAYCWYPFRVGMRPAEAWGFCTGPLLLQADELVPGQGRG
ncbi:MAG: hypothetical protein C4296_12635 [Gemmataceae bacterium]